MSIQLDGVQALQRSGLEGAQGPEGKQGLPGRVNGEKVVAQINTASQIADMAEEMSFVTGQFKQRDLKKRNAKSGSLFTERILERIKKIQTIQNAQPVKDLLNHFQNKTNLSEKDIKERVKEFSEDIPEQYVALDMAADFFDEIGDPEKAEKLRKVRDELKKENEVLIQASLNVSEAAAEIAHESGAGSETAGAVRELRKSYADHVQDHRNLEDAYDFVMKNFLHHSDDTKPARGMKQDKNFETALDKALRLNAVDLASTTPSTSRAQLLAINKGMGTLKILKGVYDNCLETEQQASRTFPDLTVKEGALMRELLKLAGQQWVTEADFERLPMQVVMRG